MITNYSYPSFKSKLPPALPKSKNTTFDFWPEFKNLCKKDGKEKRLNELLEKLYKNGDNNILALDYKPQNEYGTINYYFQLYKDTENLMADRNSKYEYQRLFSSRPLAGKEWVQYASSIKEYLQVNQDYKSQIGHEHFKKLTDALLHTLNKILTKGSKENKNIFIENQYKMKLPKKLLDTLE